MLDRAAAFFSGWEFRLENGNPIESFSRQPRDISSEYTGMATPRRVIVTPARTPLRPGNVVVDRDGIHYLLGAWPSDVFRGEPVAKQFALIECNSKLVWSRSGQEVDPISGLLRVTAKQPLGEFWAVNERRGMARDAGQFTTPDRRVICGVPLEPGDNVDSMIVKVVEQMRGLYIAEIS